MLGLLHPAGGRVANLRWTLGPEPIPEQVWPGAAGSPAWTATGLQAEAVGEALALVLALALLVLLAGVLHDVLIVLSRTAAHRDELALRSALGADRGRLRAHLLGRGARVVALGVAVGLPLGALFMLWLGGSLPGILGPSRGADAWIRAGSGYAWNGWLPLAIGIPALLLVGFAPVVLDLPRKLWRRPALALRPGDGLAGGGRGVRAGAGGLLGWSLTTGQVALCLAVTTAAVILLRAAPELEGSAGLPPSARDTIVLRAQLPEGMAAAERARALQEMEARVRALPGVGTVAYGSPGALLGLGSGFATSARCSWCLSGGLPVPVTSGRATYHAVSRDFFRLFRAPTSASTGGRASASASGLAASPTAPAASGPRPSGPGSILVDREFVLRFFQGREPTGRELWLWGRPALRSGGVPVTGTVDLERPPVVGSGRRPPPMVYLSATDHPPSAVEVAARAKPGLPPLAEGRLIRAVEGLGTGIRATPQGTLEVVFREARAPVPWLARLAGVLALAALALAGSGLLVGLSERLQMRHAEIGLRRALGARRLDVLRLGLGDGLGVVGAGIAAGLILAVPFGEWIVLLSADARPLEPTALLAIAGAVIGVALVAVVVTASRLARLDPAVALRGS